MGFISIITIMTAAIPSVCLIHDPVPHWWFAQEYAPRFNEPHLMTNHLDHRHCSLMTLRALSYNYMR